MEHLETLKVLLELRILALTGVLRYSMKKKRSLIQMFHQVMS